MTEQILNRINQVSHKLSGKDANEIQINILDIVINRLCCYNNNLTQENINDIIDKNINTLETFLNSKWTEDELNLIFDIIQLEHKMCDIISINHNIEQLKVIKEGAEWNEFCSNNYDDYSNDNPEMIDIEIYANPDYSATKMQGIKNFLIDFDCDYRYIECTSKSTIDFYTDILQNATQIKDEYIQLYLTILLNNDLHPEIKTDPMYILDNEGSYQKLDAIYTRHIDNLLNKGNPIDEKIYIDEILSIDSLFVAQMFDYTTQLLRYNQNNPDAQIDIDNIIKNKFNYSQMKVVLECLEYNKEHPDTKIDIVQALEKYIPLIPENMYPGKIDQIMEGLIYNAYYSSNPIDLEIYIKDELSVDDMVKIRQALINEKKILKQSNEDFSL